MLHDSFVLRFVSCVKQLENVKTLLLNFTKSTFQAEEFSSQIQKLASQGSSADRDIAGQKYWLA